MSDNAQKESEPIRYSAWLGDNGKDWQVNIIVDQWGGLCKVTGKTKEEAEANAQRIVKAVNMHDELVEALRKLRNAIYENKYAGGVLDAADELLKQAEGK